MLQGFRCLFTFAEHPVLDFWCDIPTIWQIVQYAILLFRCESVDVAKKSLRDVAVETHGDSNNASSDILVRLRGPHTRLERKIELSFGKAL